MAHALPRRSRRAVLGALGAPVALGAAGMLFAAPRVRAAESAAPEVLRIGFQKSAVNLVIVKQQGALERRLPNTKVSWVEFPAGPQLLEALSVGSLEFGLTGDSPPVFAQAAGKDLFYVGAESPKPESSAILVKSDAPLKSLADLRGRRIALQKGSSAHYLTVRAVAKAGLQWSDIVPVYLAPAEARAAFERDSVDAWAIWDPYYAATEIDVKTRTLATGRDLASNNSFYLASREFATRYPEAVQVLFEELTCADQYVQTHRKEAAQLIADFSGLGLGTVHRFIARRPVSPVGPLSPAIVADQQRVADAFAALGLIPKQIEVAQIVWHPAATQIARQR